MSTSIDLGTERDLSYQLIDENITRQLLDLLKKEKDDEHDLLVGQFFNHCLEKYKEKRLECMITVAVLFPDLVSNSYEDPVTFLRKKLTYIKFPSEFLYKQKFPSTREPLWSYKFPYYRFPDPKLEYKFSIPDPPLFDRWEKVAKHSATLCYLPLPGLCTYPKPRYSGVFNYLFPRGLSPLARLTISYPIEDLLNTEAILELFSSPPFQAIIKFKWHTFARRRFYGILFIHIVYSSLFTAATSSVFGDRNHRKLMIASIILGAIITFGLIRHYIILFANRASNRHLITPSVYISLVVYSLPLITGSLEIIGLLKHDVNTVSILQSSSILFLWLGIFALLRMFKTIGVFIIVFMEICKKISILLIYLVSIVFASAHFATVYLLNAPPDKAGIDNFPNFSQSFLNFWSGLLSDFDAIDSLKNDFFMSASKIIFSFLINVVILNILIALVNNVYEEVQKRSYAKWAIVRACFISELEISMMTPSERQNQDYFPWIIIYEAFTKEVDEWFDKLKADKDSTRWVDPLPDEIQDLLNKIEERLATNVTDKLHLDKIEERLATNVTDKLHDDLNPLQKRYW